MKFFSAGIERRCGVASGSSSGGARKRRWSALCLAAGVAVSCGASWTHAAEKAPAAVEAGAKPGREAEVKIAAAAEAMPGSTLFFAEVRDPSRALPLLESHPLWQRFTKLDVYRAALEKKEAKRALALVKSFEERSGMAWRAALADLTQGGVSFGIDVGTQGGVVLVRAKDAETAEKIQKAFVATAREALEKLGRDEEIEEKNYRGLQAYKYKDLVYGVCGPYILLANKAELARNVADRILDGKSGSLAEDEQFQAAAQERPAKSEGWAYLRMDVPRLLGVVKKLTEKRSDNPLGELLFGGVLTALQHAPYLTASLQVEGSTAKLAFSAPAPKEGAAADKKSVDFFLAVDDEGKGPIALPPETILSFSVQRNWSKFWQAADELFSEKIVAEMAKADSTLSLFFSGKDFSTEVLTAVKPRLEVVVVRQTFDGPAERIPTLKFPAAALVLEVDPKADLGTHFKIAFQSAVGLGNLGLSQERKPQLLMDMRKEKGVEIVTAKFLDPVRKQDVTPVEYNFSPTLVLLDGRVVLASTEKLGERIAAGLKNPSNRAAPANLELEVFAQPIAAALRDNLDALVSQNMLEKGTDRPEAEAQVGLFLEVVAQLQALDVRLTQSRGKLQLEWSLSAASASEAKAAANAEGGAR